MTYYHVTPIQNWENIKINGLIPAKIKRGKGFEESLPAVYLFNSVSDAEDGFFNKKGKKSHSSLVWVG